MTSLTGRPCKAPLGVAVFALTTASSLALACRGSCRTLERCEAEQCAVLSAVRVGQEQPKPVGCIEKEQNDAPGVSTYARDGAGVCWIFPTTLIAQGFVADESCSP